MRSLAIAVIVLSAVVTAQSPNTQRPPTRADFLRGEYGRYRANNDLLFYHLDVRVDPDWLTYLVQPFLHSEVVAAGGPNVVPADDPWMAQCVARAPGGPTHVLLDDREVCSRFGAASGAGGRNEFDVAVGFPGERRTGKGERQSCYPRHYDGAAQCRELGDVKSP